MKLSAIFLFIQVAITSVSLFCLYKIIYIYCGVQQLGILSLLMATSGLTKLAEFGMGAGIVKFVAQYSHKDNAQKCRGIIETAVMFIALTSLATVGILYFPLVYAVNKYAPAELVSTTAEVVPYVLALLLITSTHTALQSAIDGLNLIYVRAIILSVGNILAPILALIYIDRHGLLAVIGSQIIIGVLYTVSYILILKSKLVEIKFFRPRFCKESFQEMIGYNLSFQTITFLSLLFDPITKALLGFYGGLVNVGFYEMASKLLGQVKNFITLPNQVVVPIVAKKANAREDSQLNLYRINYALILIVAAPIYALLMLLVPLISELWTGSVNSVFVGYTVVLSIAFFVNALSNPAYYYSIGNGDLRENINTHILIALINLAFGGILGSLLGGYGVIVGWAISLSAGSIYLIVKTQNKFSFKIKDIQSPGDVVRLIVMLVLCGVLTVAFPIFPNRSTAINAAISALLGLSVAVFMIANSGYFKFLKKIFQKGDGNAWKFS